MGPAESLSYAEFVAHALGLQFHEVYLRLGLGS